MTRQQTEDVATTACPHGRQVLGFSLLRQRNSPAGLALLLALAGVHIAFTWGHVGTLWGDPGRWLHEVDRFAHGEILYRDFYWPFPPFALWFLGSIDRVFGSDLVSIWTATAIVFVLICLAYDRYVHLLVPRPLALSVVLAGFLLACAYANVDSAPLPAGTYTPAGPVGLLLMLLAVICAINLLDGFRLIYALGTGIFCGLCILTKQDFWVPALYLVIAGTAVLLSVNDERKRNLALHVWTSFLVTVFAGYFVVFAQAGGRALLDVLLGGGQVAELRGRTFPSGQRLTSEMIVMALIGLLSALLPLTDRTISWKAVKKWVAVFVVVAIACCSLHVFMTYRIASGLRVEATSELLGETAAYLSHSSRAKAPLFRVSLRWLKRNLLLHVLPLLLPVSVLVLLFIFGRKMADSPRWKLVLFLLGVCVTARLKRGFEHTEWYHFLLEIPVYAAAAFLFLPNSTQKASRALRLGFGLLLAFGAYAYWNFGVGPLARNSQFERVDTPRGSAWVSAGMRKQFTDLKGLLDQVDPGGKRPLFAFAYNGGFDYFLDRVNPTPLTQGFRLSIFDPDRVVRDVLAQQPAALVLDRTNFDQVPVPSPHFKFLPWDLKTVLNFYVRYDRPYFQQILVHCRPIEELQFNPILVYTLHDCSNPPEGAARR